MNQNIIIDTGPIVALLSHKDQYHSWAVNALNSLKTPFLTTEANITEAFHILSNTSNAHSRLFQLLQNNLIQIKFSLSQELSHIQSLMLKYKDTPMDFADACIVRLTEIFVHSTVFTIDSDFKFYKRFGKQNIPTLLPI